MAETSAEKALCEKSSCYNDMYSHCEDEDVKEVLQEMIDTVSDGIICEKESCKKLNVVPSTDTSSYVDLEKNPTIQNGNYEKVQHSSKQSCSKQMRRTRSISENESEADINPREITRRKFGSEGAALSIAKNIIPPEQEKQLNEAVEQYIDKLIRESVFKAVRNVNVENLCKNILKDISVRKNSLDLDDYENDFGVEKSIHHNSISEPIELENDARKNNGNNLECRDPLILNDSGRISETESLDHEIDDVDQVSFKGYLADLDDTTSIDDFKSEDVSLNSSMSSNWEQKNIYGTPSDENAEKSTESVKYVENIKKTECEDTSKDLDIVSKGNTDPITELNNEDSLSFTDHSKDQQETILSVDVAIEQSEPLKSTENADELKQNSGISRVEQSISSPETLCEQKQTVFSASSEPKESLSSTKNVEEEEDKKFSCSANNHETVELVVASPEEEHLFPKPDENTDISPEIAGTLPQQIEPAEDQAKVNWKVGYLHVKLPHKTRGKAKLKAWKKRRVIIQPDEFVNDPKNPSLVISVYGADSKKHETTFWHSVSSLKAVVFRSSSRTHRYAFTISDGGEPIIHLSSDRETTTQEWMAAIRSVLWPPSPFMELEKMLSGREFEISIVDNEFSYHAGLLGMYGYLSITPKKLILLHPQQGYVIQEWYLNTVDKFQFVPQPKADDDHKVLCMTTCRDSSTGQGDLIFFCNEAVTLLQSLASNIHQVLSYHSKQEGGRYQKELEEIAEWLVAPPQDCLNVDATADEHYQVPPRQVKSLLDIPNFIFNKSLSPVASAIYPAPNSEILEPLERVKYKPITTSHDSGISTGTEDFLNCSVASFIIGGGPLTGKSSDSELSDTYTPPRTPEISKKVKCEVLLEEQVSAGEV